jgi:hypothetical protein
LPGGGEQRAASTTDADVPYRDAVTGWRFFRIPQGRGRNHIRRGDARGEHTTSFYNVAACECLFLHHELADDFSRSTKKSMRLVFRDDRYTSRRDHDVSPEYETGRIWYRGNHRNLTR